MSVITYQVVKRLDPRRFFSENNTYYEFLEFTKIVNECKQNYGEYVYNDTGTGSSEACAYQFDFYKHFNRIPNDEEGMRGILSPKYLYPKFPRFIFKQYDIFKQIYSPEFKHDFVYTSMIICKVLGCEKYTYEIPSNIDKYLNNKFAEKSIEYLINIGEFADIEVIEILLAYKNKLGKIPDRLIKIITDICKDITPDNINKYISEELLNFAQSQKVGYDCGLDRILSVYVDEFDKINLDLDVKSMLLMFKTMREDVSEIEDTEDNNYYKIPKELINQLLDHPGFARYAH